MVRFVPNVEVRAITDASYHLPAFYELFARWGPVEDRSVLGQGRRCEPRCCLAKVTGPQYGPYAGPQ
jgi:oligosaccharide reducing-end xylanase